MRQRSEPSATLQPSSGGDVEAKARAWDEVCDALTKKYGARSWLGRGSCGVEAAKIAIGELQLVRSESEAPLLIESPKYPDECSAGKNLGPSSARSAGESPYSILSEAIDGALAVLDEQDGLAAELREAQKQAEAALARSSVEGTWPKDDLRRAFVEGMKWWEYRTQQATAWQSDVTLAEAEAERRYGTVSASEFAMPERDAALAWCEQLLQNLDLEHGERSRLQGIRDYILRTA